MGVVYSRLGDAAKALDSHNRALPLHRAAENRRGEATTLRYIGIEHFQSDPQKAIEPWQQARAIFKALQDDREEASTIIWIARAYGQLKATPGGEDNLARSLELFEQARLLSDAAGDRRNVARTLQFVAEVHKRREKQDLSKILRGEKWDLSKALEASERARTLYREVDDVVGEAGALTQIGEINSESRQQRRALEA